MAGELFKDNKSVRTGLRPFENVLNEFKPFH